MKHLKLILKLKSILYTERNFDAVATSELLEQITSHPFFHAVTGYLMQSWHPLPSTDLNQWSYHYNLISTHLNKYPLNLSIWNYIRYVFDSFAVQEPYLSNNGLIVFQASPFCQTLYLQTLQALPESQIVDRTFMLKMEQISGLSQECLFIVYKLLWNTQGLSHIEAQTNLNLDLSNIMLDKNTPSYSIDREALQDIMRTASSYVFGNESAPSFTERYFLYPINSQSILEFYESIYSPTWSRITASKLIHIFSDSALAAWLNSPLIGTFLDAQRDELLLQCTESFYAQSCAALYERGARIPAQSRHSFVRQAWPLLKKKASEIVDSIYDDSASLIVLWISTYERDLELEPELALFLFTKVLSQGEFAFMHSLLPVKCFERYASLLIQGETSSSPVVSRFCPDGISKYETPLIDDELLKVIFTQEPAPQNHQNSLFFLDHTEPCTHSTHEEVLPTEIFPPTVEPTAAENVSTDDPFCLSSEDLISTRDLIFAAEAAILAAPPRVLSLSDLPGLLSKNPPLMWGKIATVDGQDIPFTTLLDKPISPVAFCVKRPL